MKVVRIDGRLHVIRAWHSDHGYELEPLADTLARSLFVQGLREPVTLGEALMEAGWTPPAEEAERDAEA